MADLEEDLVGYLDSLGLTGGATGWTARMGALPDDTDQAIAVVETGGGERERSLVLNRPSFQLLFRGRSRKASATARRDTRAKVSATVSAIENATRAAPTGVTLNGTLYPWIWAEGGAISLAYDEQERPLFSHNFTCARSG